MFYIILSKVDNYISQAKKFVEMSPEKVKIVYLEDYLENQHIVKLNSYNTIYILNNSELIVEFIKLVEKTKCRILNRDFYLCNYNKLDIQKMLCQFNVPVPKLLNFDDITKKNIPLFVKGLKHVSMVFKAYTMQSLELFFSRFDIKDFYLETAVDNKETKEYKVYFVDDRVFFDDNFRSKTPDILEVCRNIKKALRLDVFSVDIIVNNAEKFILDVNPAAGFFLSKGSREALLRRC